MKNRIKRKQRQGAAMIVCLVLLVFLGTLSGVVIKTVLDDRREARTELIRQQIQILLTDGQDRANRQRRLVADFSGETLEFQAKKTNPPGVFRIKSVFNDERKTFDLEVAFLDENEKTIIARKSE